MTPTTPGMEAGRATARDAAAWSRPYLVGIGGCGMSGLAQMLAARGATPRGSDCTDSALVRSLRASGIAVDLEQETAPIPEDADAVIVSAAIHPDHPQALKAQERGLPLLAYAEALGACMVGRTGVAIAGTHGKSTTTAMLGVALGECGLDPSVIVGATCSQLARAGGATPGAAVGFRLGAATIPAGDRAGQPGIVLAEACEFNRSFHHLRPTIASIGNIEADHLDIYGSLDAVIEAFAGFARLVPSDGTLLIAHEGAHRREVAAGLACDVQTIGFSPSADWTIGYDPGSREVYVARAGEATVGWVNKMAGEHNAINAATAYALGRICGADGAKLAESLGIFRGLDRRMQFLGQRDGVRVYDDYGHHPTEIEATLRALRQAERPDEKGGRLICVFQPHQHSRTRHLLEEFATSFEQADVVIVPHIYFVRDSEAEKQRVSASDLVDRLRTRGVRAMHLYPFEAIVEQLENLCHPGDLLVVMGAGPVWQVARGYLKDAAA
ncbi:MAG: cyanophycin synthetase [Phycisphaerales bacterium]